MKYVILFLQFQILTVGVSAQQILLKKDSLPVLGKLNHPLYNSSSILGSNQLGTIYALPQDKMPALRPDSTLSYQMPVHLFQQPGAIYPYRGLVPNPLDSEKEKRKTIQTPDGPRRINIH